VSFSRLFISIQVPYELLNPIFNNVADLALNRRQWKLVHVQNGIQVFVLGPRVKVLTSIDCEIPVVARILGMKTSRFRYRSECSSSSSRE
jgi:hypothetical protein